MSNVVSVRPGPLARHARITLARYRCSLPPWSLPKMGSQVERMISHIYRGNLAPNASTALPMPHIEVAPAEPSEVSEVAEYVAAIARPKAGIAKPRGNRYW